MKFWIKTLTASVIAFLLSGGSTILISRGVEKAQYESNFSSDAPESEANIPVAPVLSDNDKFINSLSSMGNLEGNLQCVISTSDYVFNISSYIAVGMEDLNNISAKANLSLKYDDVNLDIGVTYIDETIFLDLFDQKIKLQTSKFSDLLDVFSSFDIPLTLPEELTNINLDNLMGNLATMEVNKKNNHLFYDFYLFNDCSPIVFESDLDYNLCGLSLNNFSFAGVSINAIASVIVLGEGNNKVVSPESDTIKYVDGSQYFGLAKTIKSIFEKEQLGIAYEVSATNEDDILSVNGNIDFSFVNNNIKAAIIGDFGINGYTKDYEVSYLNDAIYVNLNNTFKVGYTVNGINDLITIIKGHLLEEPFISLVSSAQNISLPVVELIKQEKYKEVISYFDSISFTDTSIKLTLDGNAFGTDSLVSISIEKQDDEFKKIVISDLSIMGYSINVSLTLCDYIEIKDVNSDEYSMIDTINNTFDDIFNLVQQTKFGANIYGSIGGITFGGSTQFDLDTKSGCGTISIDDPEGRTHNVIIDITGPENDEFNAEMVFDYFDANNNHMKGIVSIASLNELINVVMDILNSGEIRWSQYVDKINETILSETINRVKNGEYEALLIDNIINSFVIDESGITVEVNGNLIGETNPLTLKVLTKEDGSLKGVSILGTAMGLDLDINVELTSFNAEHLTLLTVDDSYIDFGDITTLVEYLFNTAQLNYFDLSGKLGLGGSTIMELASSLLGVDMDLEAKVVIDEEENVSAYIAVKGIPTTLLLSNYGTIGNDSNSEMYIDIKNECVYIHNKVTGLFNIKMGETSLKLTLNEFINNIEYYLVNVFLNMKIDIPETKENLICFPKIISSYSFTDGENPKWQIALNMANLVGSNALNDLTATITGNKDGYISGLNASLGVLNGLLDVNINASLNNIGKEFDFSFFTNYINDHANDQFSYLN